MLIKTPLLYQSFGPRIYLSIYLSIYLPSFLPSSLPLSFPSFLPSFYFSLALSPYFWLIPWSEEAR